MQTVEKCAILQ